MSCTANKWALYRSAPGKPIIAGMLLIIFTTIGLAGSCGAFRMPWVSSDEDILQDKLNDIWTAILANDRATLKNLIIGFGADAFIAQERQFAQSTGVVSFDIQVRSVRFDHLKAFAFVDFDRIGTIKNGRKVSHRFLKAFRRDGQDWKFMANVKTKKRR